MPDNKLCVVMRYHCEHVKCPSEKNSQTIWICKGIGILRVKGSNCESLDEGR